MLNEKADERGRRDADPHGEPDVDAKKYEPHHNQSRNHRTPGRNENGSDNSADLWNLAAPGIKKPHQKVKERRQNKSRRSGHQHSLQVTSQVRMRDR